MATWPRVLAHKVKFSVVVLQEGFPRGVTTLTDMTSGEIGFRKWEGAENGESHWSDMIGR